ncbi:MAG: dihydroxy-acid dehydratase [Clostridiales bacterium]|nr:dihydroxy-acid dehydratase [Clostridiales bacterium]
MLREYIKQLDKLPQSAMANSLEIDSNKPIIGIVSAQNELAVAHNHLDDIYQRVKEGVLSKGASAKIIHVPSIDNTALRGTQSAKYDLPSRELTANAIELACSTDYFDGLVFVASEPNIVAGMLLGAIRLNMPCAFICQGVMTPIYDQGVEHGLYYFYDQIAKVKLGSTPHNQLAKITKNIPLVTGTDCDSYGANSFNCVLEVLGLAAKGNGTATATSAERYNIAYKTGELAVTLVQGKCSPRRMIKQTTLCNAIKFDLACGGSTSTLLNLIAIAKELAIKNVNLKAISEICKKTPLLLRKEKLDVCLMTQFHNAGGSYAMLKQLLEAKLVTGDTTLYEDSTLDDVLSEVTIANTNVICPIENCVASSARIKVIDGNVAEEGALVQFNGTDVEFTGVAKIYNNEEMAVEAILRREIHTGDVVVIRGEGPKSGPGMREIYVSLALLKAFGLEKVAVVTDGRIADIYNGFAVGHVTPETGERNIFSVLQDGDEIEINVAKGKINCDIKAKELANRYRNCDEGVGNYGNLFLKNWSKTCGSASEGCVTKVTK